MKSVDYVCNFLLFNIFLSTDVESEICVLIELSLGLVNTGSY